MRFKDIVRTITFVVKNIVENGPHYTMKCFIERYFVSPNLPLAGVDKDLLLSSNTRKVRRGSKRSRGQEMGGMFSDSSNLEASYPLVHEFEGQFLRYSFAKASGEAKGLVILFHGWGGEYSSGLRPKGWEEFDVVAPWDTFGHNRRGSWFWGVRGDDIVARGIESLVLSKREENQSLPLFCYGGSMGGFGAIYHAIRLNADGVYAMMPQVDIGLKIKEYSADGFDNPYGFLQGGGEENIPDLVSLAANETSLPPLFLIQNQYDAVNPFAEHGFKLIEIYNQKQGWYGLRVYPAIGHCHDGSPEEASYFFKLITERDFPRNMNNEL